MKAKDTYHHGDLRRALLEGAVVEVAERGVAAFSLSALARTLKVSSAAPYRHFADLEALFAAVAVEGYARLGARFSLRLAAGEGGPEAAVVAMGIAYVEFAAEEPGYFAVMFGGVVDKARFPEVRAAGDHVLARLLGTVAELGGTAADALSFWALAHGYAVLVREGLWAETPGAPPPAEAAAAAGRSLIAGIRAR
jgi:AcrR family transcriptional regulator